MLPAAAKPERVAFPMSTARRPGARAATPETWREPSIRPVRPDGSKPSWLVTEMRLSKVRPEVFSSSIS